MRNPNNIIKEYDIEEPPVLIEMDSIPPYDKYDYDLNDEKSFANYMKAVEKCVRSSFEYKQYTSYLRNYMDMNKCAFYENVSNTDTTKIKIHIHHEPLSLYDICRIVFNKRSSFNEPLDEEYVAKEVMYLHYNLMVGLIPLAETIHELVHAEYLFVPTTAVLGKYKEFVNAYNPFIDPEMLDVLDAIEKATDAYTDDINKKIMSKHYIYINMGEENNKQLPTMKDIESILRNKISEIHNNQFNN